MQLIVGLGNPGMEYRDTRHNVGFKVVETVAEQAGAWFDHGEDDALVAKGQLHGHSVVVAKPLTYMNRSGAAVARLMRRYDVAPDALLVVVDDINLPPGTIRLRPSGSAGGHNGAQSIIDRLGTNAFPRLRVGIGNDFARGDQVDYVLSPFDAQQQPLIEDALLRSREAVQTCVTGGIETAMNRFN